MDTFESSGRAAATASVQYLSRPEGRISYRLDSPAEINGPLVVLVPGMGDLRSTWRELDGPLRAAGYRVAVTDLRGHGDSDTTFARHGDVATAEDLIALIEHLDAGPAVLVGNSMGASASAWAAAERPELVAGLVLVSPFLREPAQSQVARQLTRLLYRAMFARPWGAAAWASYYRSALNKGTHAPWLTEHVADIRASFREPSRLRSFRSLVLQLTHAPVEERVAEIGAPSIAFIGTLDPDYKDPAAELAWIVRTVGAQGVAVPGVAHYPQSQAPDVVVPATLSFLGSLRRDGARWSAGARA